MIKLLSVLLFIGSVIKHSHCVCRVEITTFNHNPITVELASVADSLGTYTVKYRIQPDCKAAYLKIPSGAYCNVELQSLNGTFLDSVKLHNKIHQTLLKRDVSSSGSLSGLYDLDTTPIVEIKYYTRWHNYETYKIKTNSKSKALITFKKINKVVMLTNTP
ncbi:unnamed protein product [Gordionus sp. m RMFG-2023]|uniref:uncharacterized protein LOC135927316 n=1 Tax=Gordionus sp. m RMFG-2023 TaxID=3053472 RepID=UPI0030DF7AE6